MDNNHESDALLSDEEFEAVLDEFLDSIGEIVEEEELKTTVLNIPRVKQFKMAYAAIRHIVRGRDIRITYKMFEPFKTMGSISVEGSSLEFDKPEWFARVAALASNTEVYPLTKNTVRLTFTFHGLTTPIE